MTEIKRIRPLDNSVVTSCYVVPGLPHILLAPEKSPAWTKLNAAYARVREEIENSDADLILYFSTQWLSVLGYLFMADPQPEWVQVDHNWHDLGSMPYKFKVDTDFASAYAREVGGMGHYVREVNYKGFPIDTGTIVAQKLLNPKNRLPAAMASCNMYAEKQETLSFGQAAVRALEKTGKRAIVVVVSNLSNRFEIKDIDPLKDQISSLKDDEWNRKVLEIFGEGRLEDVSEVAREFSRQANADMGFKGIWWLNGLCGKTNNFIGKVFEYQPVWGTGSALVGLYPTEPIRSIPDWVNDEHDLVERTKILSGSEQGGAVQDHVVSGQDAWAKPSAESAGTHGATDRPAAGLGHRSRPAPDSGADRGRWAVSSATGDLSAAYAAAHSGSTLEAKARAEGKISTSKAPEPVGPYPHARRVGDFVFLSGVGPRQRGTKTIPGVTLDAEGNVVAHDIDVQTRSVIENVKAILEDAGSSLEEVVDVQVYLTDMKRDFTTFNKVYGEYFAKIGPTRTTVEVTALPTPIAIELKVTAFPRGVPPGP